MIVGYARVSTAEQNPDHQIDALLRAGVDRENIHVDHASGAKASRPAWDVLYGKVLRRGDTLKVTRLDRLGRSVLHLVTLGAELRDRGVELHVIEQGIDTVTAEGRAMFGMLSVLAELQRELTLANTHDGLASARARGRVGGRKPKLSPEQAALAQQQYDAGRRPSSRSPTCSACRARPCTATSIGRPTTPQRRPGRGHCRHDLTDAARHPADPVGAKGRVHRGRGHRRVARARRRRAARPGRGR
jgi:DNA invertase Pin-like site-specific DNA recombinase